MAGTQIVAQNNEEKNKYHYSQVSLSLENCILPPERLTPSPSQVDGLDPESEMELRILGCEWIQTSGILLRLPQTAMATGQVLFQRFFYSKSFVRQPMEVIAMACITLASKIEEAPRRIRDVANVFHHVKQVKAGKTIQPLILDQNYINLKNQVIKGERRVLKELGFCVHVKHPHKIIVTLLEVLKVKNRKLMQTAWNYMNDSLRTNVFLRYDPEAIACSCIHLSARLLQIPLPNKPAWYLVFGVSEENISDICGSILFLYTRKKPDPEKLEKIVEELKKSHMDAKLKAKGLAQLNNLPNSSPAASLMGSPRNGVKSPSSDSKKDRSDGKHNDTSPRYHRDSNHRKRRSVSPLDDNYQSPEPNKKRSKTSSSGSGGSSHSSSPKRKQKTPPRGFKDSHRSRSRSRSKTRSSKKAKHRSHKRKHSLSPEYSPTKHSSSGKKSYKNKHSDKSHHARSRSRSHERNHHHTNSLHEKSHKNRREKVKENHHSREKKRR
ncbi:cyclin-L1 [Parasteatoda tepidariorum]|uniref:cyclin-L1 n=1 Tax=Parasteatoda tepidariorum TaxID=114398 RepID=UPI00077F8C10|nr:cyclin-L1 [Parasteatoda tepidariorum]